MNRLLALPLVSLCFLGCNIPRYAAERSVQEQLETSPLTLIDLSTFNGKVKIQTHDAPVVDLDIKYTARGESQEAAQAAVEQMGTEISAEDGILKLVATKPKDQWTASASYTLVVPRKLGLKLRSSNGLIQVEALEGDIDISTSNGKILLDGIHGNLQAHTSNGTISAKNCDGPVNFRTSNGRIEWEGPFAGSENELRTSNGSVSVKIPEEFVAEISASTSNGSIRCNVPIGESISKKKRSMHFITAGNSVDSPAKLNLKTSNGSVTVGLIETSSESPEMSPEITLTDSSDEIAL